MSSRSTALLRYRFHSTMQLLRHLHLAEGRALIFYRNIELPVGQRVSLEVYFDDTENRVLLQGSVLSTLCGMNPGVWLEFVDTGLTRLETGFVSVRQRRLGCEAMVQVDQNRDLIIGRMVDVSMGGARILSVGDVRPEIAVQLRVLVPEASWPQDLGFAQVVRADLSGVAVRFLRSDPKTRLAAMRLFNAVQEDWAAAVEREHPMICCQDGVHLDPRPPALRALFTRHEVQR